MDGHRRAANRRQRQHAADGQINAAGNNDQRHAAGEHAIDRGLPERVAVGAELEERAVAR